MLSGLQQKKDRTGYVPLLWYNVYMNEIIILQKIEDIHTALNKVSDESQILKLKKDLKLWKRHLADVRRHNLEDRAGFKNLERNA
tara:strand:- start:884 stop:1138 length:255 start_codon:yes stop_codon:yes gene_type:complete